MEMVRGITISTKVSIFVSIINFLAKYNKISWRLTLPLK